ncbi:hypothetical protein CRG98_010679, partial [Punica granatum]
MALWAKDNTPTVPKVAAQKSVPDNHADATVIEDDLNVTVERELVSQAEEEDMETLLGTYVMGIGEAEAFSERLKRELHALEAANVHAILECEPMIDEVLQGLEVAANCIEDMDEWLGIFNVKLRHMREDIQSIETRNNKLELQSVNNRLLTEEVDRLLERLRIPPEVKERRGELEILKSNFIHSASAFLRNYFAGLVDNMLADKNSFSQKLDKNCLVPLRKAYCGSFNFLFRREVKEFSNELRASTKAPKNATLQWLEGPTGSSHGGNPPDSSMVAEAYSKMLTVFVPLLVDESSFFAHFMCFDVPTLVPAGNDSSGHKSMDSNDDDLGIMDIDDNDSKGGKNPAELAALNEALRDLLDGVQEDFYAVVDWACKIDPLRCISLHGITDRYISSQKADAAGFVRLLLDDLEGRISMQFGRFVDETCHQIERNERTVRQTNVLPYISRFATLATRMEQYIQGQNRDLVDQAYTKLVSIMFVTLEKVAETDLKYADIFLLENYAAFQNRQ